MDKIISIISRIPTRQAILFKLQRRWVGLFLKFLHFYQHVRNFWNFWLFILFLVVGSMHFKPEWTIKLIVLAKQDKYFQLHLITAASMLWALSVMTLVNLVVKSTHLLGFLKIWSNFSVVYLPPKLLQSINTEDNSVSLLGSIKWAVFATKFLLFNEVHPSVVKHTVEILFNLPVKESSYTYGVVCFVRQFFLME